MQAKVERHQNLVFAGEVVVDGRLREAEPLGDLAQRGLVEPLLDEQVEGDVEDAVASARLADEFSAGLDVTTPSYFTSGKGICLPYGK